MMQKEKLSREKSLKKDLIITLSSLIVAALIIGYLASFFNTKEQVQEAFDANLAKSSKLIFGLIKHEVGEEKDFNFLSNITPDIQHKIFHHSEYEIHSQAWQGDYLVYKSDDISKLEKPNYEGFKDIETDKEKWRSFSFYDAKTNITILVLEKYSIRNELIFQILFSLLVPLLLSLISLFLIIYFTINRKLKPLDRLSSDIEKMSAKTLQQLKNPGLPLELKPFINSFNSLIEKLLKSMESEQRFTNYAAHELKTPLAAINIQTHLLISNTDKEKEKKYSQNLLNGVNRATHLVNQLLTLSRLDPDSKNVEKEKFNFEDSVNFVLNNYIEKAEEKNLTIEVNCDAKESRLFIEANKTYIEIMLGNLIDNAIKYSPKDQKISIIISEKNNLLSFKISNFGEQIMPEEMEKLFNNFYRVSRLKTAKDNVGCGLGLAIARKIADLHAAEIAFESRDGINSVKVLLPYA